MQLAAEHCQGLVIPGCGCQEIMSPLSHTHTRAYTGHKRLSIFFLNYSPYLPSFWFWTEHLFLLMLQAKVIRTALCFLHCISLQALAQNRQFSCNPGVSTEPREFLFAQSAPPPWSEEEVQFLIYTDRPCFSKAKHMPGIPVGTKWLGTAFSLSFLTAVWLLGDTKLQFFYDTFDYLLVPLGIASCFKRLFCKLIVW